MATILIVDDQPVNRQFLATLLGYFSHKVREAANGFEALQILKDERVDLVITDVLMPTMDGYDFLTRMRNQSATVRTPVILYTAAKYEQEARIMAEACGVRQFLTKPAEPEIILAAVNSALGREPAGSPRAGLTRFNRHVLSPPADPIDPNAVVFIVDDDCEARTFLSEIVANEGLNSQIYPCAQEFLDNIDGAIPGCLVLDIYMPGMTGISLLEELCARRIQIPTIILTGHGHTADAVQAMRFGVVDFLEKTVDRRILLAKIYVALQEDSIRRRAQTQSDAVRQRMAGLTIREKELVKLLVLGKSSKEIAAELQLSVKTVSNHRTRLMAKTQALNLGDLVRMSMLAFDK